MEPAHLFAERMRADADHFERRGLRESAALIRSYADELEAFQQDHDNKLLTLDEAAKESGYHRDHVSRLVSQDRLPNRGQKGTPRIRRGDLPKKPRSEPLSLTSAGGPQIVRASLIDQGIVSAES